MRIALLLELAGLSVALRRKSHRSHEANAGGQSWKRDFDNYMSTIMATDNPEGINEPCTPYISEPRGASRGLVILQHGFTACAGFWYLMAPAVVADGWTVMVPNMPGTGRTPKIEKVGSGYEVTDYTDDFPEHGGEYEDFSGELIKIVSKYKRENPGSEVIVVGCSHGGGVATYMAMNADEGTIDRVLLMNPFLSPPTSLGADYGLSLLRDLVPQVLPAFSLFRSEFITWGDDCNNRRWPTDPRQKDSTGGVCTFTLKNFRGVLEFGNNVEGEARARAAQMGVFTGGIVDRAVGVLQAASSYAWNFITGNTRAPPSNLRVQIVTTENDGAISNARVHFAAEALQYAVIEGNSEMCALPESFEHTYINPPDKPLGSDLWWLDSSRVQGGRSMIDMLVGFVSDGRFLPAKGTVQSDSYLEGDAACDVQKKR